MIDMKTTDYIEDIGSRVKVAENWSCCEDCGATQDLIESGGQFSGGTWYVCIECDDKGKKFQEWMKSPEFLETLKRIERKD